MYKVGTLLVIVGIIVFISIPFITKHELTYALIVNEYKEDKKVNLASDIYKKVLNKSITTWEVISITDKAIDHINEELSKPYFVSEEDILKLKSLALNNSFHTEGLKVIWPNSGHFKIAAFEKHGNWLSGRSFPNEKAMEDAIRQVVDNVLLYEIIQKKGINKYTENFLKYSIAKHSITGLVKNHALLLLLLTIGLSAIGGLLMLDLFMREKPGIKNDGIFFHPEKSRKWLGIIIGVLLTAFYILLYFFPSYMVGWIKMVDPISYTLNGSEAGQFFLYGFMYTVSIMVMGVRMIIKYRTSQYHILRTISIIFFQTLFAFLIPEVLVRLNQPYFDFKNAWPLDYDFFFDFELEKLIAGGNIGIFMLVWGIVFSLIGVPIFTYFYGKRWYCSWICGCGGLAETVGDPFRQLSDKSLKAWKIERYLIYSVLVFSIFMTFGVLYTYFTGSSQFIGINTFSMREVYGVFIGAGFSGVVGTGVYPIMGNRVWCRFGCPLAAYMGIVQKFKSRFRITTNGGQCISCGNCSTYCEMGIDVRAYAQRGQNIVRASCVGCGVCASVCPRGVLKLENKKKERKDNFNKFINL